jgi:hypothetical protein
MLEHESISTTLKRPARAAGVFIAHLALGTVVLVGIWLTERQFQLLWKTSKPLFFDWIPVKWLFDAADCGVMVVFIVFGIYEAARQLRP